MSKNRHKSSKSSPEYITERIKIEKFIPGGQALGTLADGKKCFFWGALPGETVVKAEVTKSKSTFAEAIALDIAEPSPYRISPRDAAYLATSPWQILDYSYELAQKSALLREIFRQQKINLPEATNLTFQTDGRDFYYRNKMEYALYYSHEDGQIHLAFHARGSHQKIPITSSSIERPEIFQRATEIVAELNRTGAEARNFQSLLLRANQAGEVSGGLFENHQPRPIFPPLTDEILGYSYRYSVSGFFQINLPVYKLALKTIKQYITTPRVLDLYAGVGTIGLSVARDRNLTLVECDKSAYHELETNCHDVATATPVYAKSEEALDFITSDQTVILDPPRAGCDSKLIEKLLDTTPPIIIYLSCNPITQARDLKILLASGKYRLKSITPFNFFPRTPHLENLVILEKL